MGDDSTKSNVWPLPKFYFEVSLGADLGAIKFQEVSGLDAETQPIEYRGGNAPAFSTVKMPGLVKYGNVTLKKGLFKKDDRFWHWYNDIKMNTIKRSEVIIKLLDESGATTMKWTLSNAWATKVTGADLNAEGDEVAIESLELAHEGIQIEQP